MDLKRKLPLAFGAVLLLMLASGLGGLWLARGALQTFDQGVQQRTEDERQAAALAAHFKTQVQEWKNVLLRGSDAALLARHWQAFEAEEKAVIDGATALRGSMAPGVQHDTLARFETSHRQMAKTYREGLEKFQAAGMEPSVGDAAVRGVDREPARLLAQLQQAIAAERAVVAGQAGAGGRSAVLWSGGLMLLAALLGMAIARHISRQVAASLQQAIRVAEQVAQGELHHPIDAGGRDEAARLLQAMAQMQASLRQLVGGVRSGAESVARASTEIAQGNGELATRTEQQASALQMTAGAMTQLGGTVRQNADSARQASQWAASASEVAARGGAVVGQVVGTMQDINDSARRIADIIGVIDGIAFQTNILALNAAVEAARAGASGRGFAVVAGEVRSLAQRSAEAAREIRGLIQASVARAEQGNALASQAGATMREVVGSIEHVHRVVRAISQASAEQSAGVGQVGEAVGRMDEGTQQNAALVEQTSAAAEQLRRQAGALVRMVAAFRV